MGTKALPNILYDVLNLPEHPRGTLMGPAPRRPAGGPINLSHGRYKPFVHTRSNDGSQLLYIRLKGSSHVYILNFLRAARSICDVTSVHP